MSVVHVDVDEYAMPKTRSSAVVNTDPASLLGNGPHWLHARRVWRGAERRHKQGGRMTGNFDWTLQRSPH